MVSWVLIGIKLLILTAVITDAQDDDKIVDHCKVDSLPAGRLLPKIAINGLTDLAQNFNRYLAVSGRHFWAFGWLNLPRMPTAYVRFMTREAKELTDYWKEETDEHPALDPTHNQSDPLVGTLISRLENKVNQIDLLLNTNTSQWFRFNFSDQPASVQVEDHSGEKLLTSFSLRSRSKPSDEYRCNVTESQKVNCSQSDAEQIPLRWSAESLSEVFNPEGGSIEEVSQFVGINGFRYDDTSTLLTVKFYEGIHFIQAYSLNMTLMSSNQTDPPSKPPTNPELEPPNSYYLANVTRLSYYWDTGTFAGCLPALCWNPTMDGGLIQESYHIKNQQIFTMTLFRGRFKFKSAIIMGDEERFVGMTLPDYVSQIDNGIHGSIHLDLNRTDFMGSKDFHLNRIILFSLTDPKVRLTWDSLVPRDMFAYLKEDQLESGWYNRETGDLWLFSGRHHYLCTLHERYLSFENCRYGTTLKTRPAFWPKRIDLVLSHPALNVSIFLSGPWWWSVPHSADYLDYTYEPALVYDIGLEDDDSKIYDPLYTDSKSKCPYSKVYGLERKTVWNFVRDQQAPPPAEWDPQPSKRWFLKRPLGHQRIGPKKTKKPSGGWLLYIIIFSALFIGGGLSYLIREDSLLGEHALSWEGIKRFFSSDSTERIGSRASREVSVTRIPDSERNQTTDQSSVKERQWK